MDYFKQIPESQKDILEQKILQKVAIEKKYLDANYNLKQLAKDIDSNTKYVSGTINERMNCNFSELISGFRVREAKKILKDTMLANLSIEQVATMSGFSNRQSFYNKFTAYCGMTPTEYRKQKAK